MSLTRCRALWLLLCATLLACSSGTEPAGVRLEIAGTVRNSATQAPVAGARVILLDKRSSFEAGYVLALSTSDAAGRYELTANAKRPGYEAGCDFVLLFVEVYEFTSGKGVVCTSQRQMIDLTVTDD